MRLRVINISGTTVGLIKVIDGRVVLDNLEPLDYRVVSELTHQMKRLADPSLKILKIIYEEESV